MDAARQALKQRLEGALEDPALFEMALRHESSSRDEPPGRPSNERLEFLGDSVLGLVVCHYLYRHHPELPEGNLATMKAALVSAEQLAAKARDLELGPCIELGRAAQGDARERVNLLADAFEAVLGAIYLDRGLEAARDFIEQQMGPELSAAGQLKRDFKSQLQEVTQRDHRCLPSYEVLQEEGPPHNRTFLLRVVVDGRELGQGQGKSKREAAQNAARAALQTLLKEGEERPNSC